MKKKSLLLLIAALVMAFSLAGCGEKEKPAVEGNTEMLTTALTNMAEAKSMSYAMDMAMAMTAEGQTLNINTVSKIDFIADPITMKMEMTMNMAGADASENANDILMNTYMESVDGQAVMYTNAGDGTWGKQTLGDASMLQQYDAAKTIEMYVSSPEQFKKVGEEEVNGSQATKFEGTISEENLNDAINASGVLNQMNLDGLDEKALKALYQGIGDLPMTIWIDQETVLPVKYEMDMSSMMQAITDKILASAGEESAKTANFSIDKVFMSVEITDYNNVSAIEIPEAARNAEEMDLTAE